MKQSERARGFVSGKLSSKVLLAPKARQGTLTAEERAELSEYEHVTALLERMQSKTRSSLKTAGATPSSNMTHMW